MGFHFSRRTRRKGGRKLLTHAILLYMCTRQTAPLTVLTFIAQLSRCFVRRGERLTTSFFFLLKNKNKKNTRYAPTSRFLSSRKTDRAQQRKERNSRSCGRETIKPTVCPSQHPFSEHARRANREPWVRLFTENSSTRVHLYARSGDVWLSLAGGGGRVVFPTRAVVGGM